MKIKIIPTINFKNLCLFFSGVFFCFIISRDLSASTSNRTKHLHAGENILSEIADLGGIDEDLVFLKGKIIIMIFASAEQEFSQKALRDVQAIIKKIKSKKIDAIGIVSSSKGHDEVKKLIDKYHFKFQIFYDEDDIATKMKVLVYPTTLILDSKGRLAYYYSLYSSGYKDVIMAQLEKISKDDAHNYIDAEAKKRKQKEEFKKAREEIERGNVSSAVAILTNILQQGHDLYNTNLLLGYSYIKLNEPEKALSCFKNAKEIEPDSVKVDLGMGIAYSRADQTENAVSILTKIVEKDPTAIFAYRELSHIFEKMDDVDKAIYYIKKEIDSLNQQIRD